MCFQGVHCVAAVSLPSAARPWPHAAVQCRPRLCAAQESQHRHRCCGAPGAPFLATDHFSITQITAWAEAMMPADALQGTSTCATRRASCCAPTCSGTTSRSGPPPRSAAAAAAAAPPWSSVSPERRQAAESSFGGDAAALYNHARTGEEGPTAGLFRQPPRSAGFQRPAPLQTLQGAACMCSCGTIQCAGLCERSA